MLHNCPDCRCGERKTERYDLHVDEFDEPVGEVTFAPLDGRQVTARFPLAGDPVIDHAGTVTFRVPDAVNTCPHPPYRVISEHHDGAVRRWCQDCGQRR